MSTVYLNCHPRVQKFGGFFWGLAFFVLGRDLGGGGIVCYGTQKLSLWSSKIVPSAWGVLFISSVNPRDSKPNHPPPPPALSPCAISLLFWLLPHVLHAPRALPSLVAGRVSLFEWPSTHTIHNPCHMDIFNADQCNNTALGRKLRSNITIAELLQS